MKQLFITGLMACLTLSLTAQDTDCSQIKPADKFTGTCATYFPGEKKDIKETRAYKDGLPHGEWKTYNEAGKLRETANYKDGKKDGEWLIWDDSGTKRYQMYYSNGTRTGLWIRGL